MSGGDVVSTKYSDCHIAPVMPTDTCSWCGKKYFLLVYPQSVGYDLELTLRRWKEGDCPTDQMLERLETELKRVWFSVTREVEPYLRKGTKRKFNYSVEKMKWEAVNE